jgi:trimethylamine--corrinoid protein Co-methyltransferase
VIVTNYADRQTPHFRVLSDAQCHEVYLAALEALDTIGVLVPNAEARGLLVAAGASADGDLVRIPAHIIQDALAATPRAFTVWGRDPARAIRVAPDRVHFGPGLTNTYFVDPETREPRLTRRGDVALTARVADVLENIDYVMGLGLLGDVTPELASVYEFAELVANTGKPIIAWAHSPENVADMLRMAAAVVGGEEALRRRPIFALFSTYHSPLRHAELDLANQMWAAEHGIPVIYLGGPTVGLESPFTGASGLLLHLAAALSGLAIVQLKRRGAPMVIGCALSPMDLRTARPAYGAPEMSLLTAAACDVARYLGVPFMGTAGATESKRLDSQAAIECSLQVLMSALSGAALVHDVGFLDCANIGSLELLVLNDEIIAMARRILRGVEVNRETLMLDLIAEVGPGGHFITEPRSAALSRREVWVPTLLDRQPYALWEKEGQKSMEQRVHEKLLRLLETHHPPALPEEVAATLQAVLAEAEARLAPQA